MKAYSSSQKIKGMKIREGVISGEREDPEPEMEMEGGK